jgi:hypothetical protein
VGRANRLFFPQKIRNVTFALMTVMRWDLEIKMSFLSVMPSLCGCGCHFNLENLIKHTVGNTMLKGS